MTLSHLLVSLLVRLDVNLSYEVDPIPFFNRSTNLVVIGQNIE